MSTILVFKLWLEWCPIRQILAFWVLAHLREPRFSQDLVKIVNAYNTIKVDEFEIGHPNRDGIGMVIHEANAKK